MTKHNLQQSLPWLLKHQHPVYDNLDHITPAAASNSSAVDDGTVRPSQDMARLQLAPQASNKPRLLTQVHRSPVPLTPGPSRPLTDRQQQQQQQHSPATRSGQPRAQTPNNQAARPRQSKTPTSVYTDSAFDDVLDIDDVEQVDLTSGDPHSSSFGDFGTPERLWDEGSATRVWPLGYKRGKKRKSEEYSKDLLSPQPRQGPAKRKADGVQAPSASQDFPDQWSDFDGEEDKDEATQKPARPAQVDHSPIQPKPYGSQLSKENAMARGQVSSVSKHDFQDSVPDSDEEDLLRALDEAEPELATLPSLISKEEDWSFSLQPAKIEEDLQEAQHPDPSQGKATRQSTPSDVRLTQQNSSLTRQNLPTPPADVDTPVTHKESEQPRDTSTPRNSRRLAPADQAIVAKYMESGTEGIKSFLTRLEASKQETIDMYAEIRIRGDTVPGWLKTKKETIASRIVAANKLLELHAQYAATLKEKDSCKRRMVEMLHNDEDIEGPFAAHIDDLAARCHAQEAAIFSQLQAAGLKDMSLPSKEAPAANAPPSEPPEPTGVLVASTQHAPPKSSQKKIQISPIRSHEGRAESDVQRALSNLVARDDSFSTERPRRQIPEKLSSIMQTPHKQPTTATTQTHGPKERSARATATSAANVFIAEENYDDFFDDEEAMLEVANAFEEVHGSKRRSRHSVSSSRSALGEMSDNVRRPAAVQLPSGSKPNATLMDNALTKEAFSALRKRFHLEGFRPNQLEAVVETMSGRDAFVLMPTGGGKSLCYQLPAILESGKTRGVTIVISPLLSLMQDQVDHLQKLKIQAMLINSEVTAEHKELVFEALRGPNPQRFIQLLYITPEMLTMSGKLGKALDDLFARQKLARIVIDEAHCVSQWGHDFRPDYKDIGNVRKRYTGVPAMALTATATENVKVDVMHNLGMTGCKVFTQSFNRPNLTYEVRPKVKGYLDGVADIIKKSYPGQSGIIYCLSRNDCERLAKKLSQHYGISAMHYHALLAPQEKASIQKRWQSGVFQVIVATIAFGMGIDKPDVRFVIHNTIPKSLEGYYQETGRAGRDGQPSGCYLYYSFGDTHSIKRMINESEGSSPEQKERQRQMLRNVVQFCENRSDCRRSQVLAYFNERFDPDQCEGGCDNCNSNSVFQPQDFTHHVKNAVELVRRVQKDDVTLLHCVDVYRGAKGVTKIRSMGHDKLPEYGMGQELERGDGERLFQRLVSDDILEEHQKTNRAGWTLTYVRLGPKVNLVRSGVFQLYIQMRVSPKGKSSARPSKPVRKKASSRATGTTGVRASIDECPMSTNVSSPLQPRSRAPRKPMVVESDYEDDDDNDDHDDYNDNQEDEEEQEEHHLDHFEPIRTASQPTRASRRRSGPPIALDERIEALDPSHRHVLDLFVEQGRALVIKTMQDNDLRTRPVADAVLREIGIDFPLTEDAMLKIHGMTKDKYNLIGPQLLRLVKSARNDYEAILQAQGDMPTNTPRGNVVEISDDDYDGGDLDFPESFEEQNESESSRYFSARGEDEPDDTPEYRSRSRAPSAKPRSAKGSFKKTSRSSSGSFAVRRGRGGTKGGASGRAPKSKFTNGGVRKKGSTASSRASGDRASIIKSYSLQKSGSGRGGSAMGIGMMPT